MNGALTDIAINPGLALLTGAFLLLAAPRAARLPIAVASGLAALAMTFVPDFGEQAAISQIGVRIVPLRLDALSQTFAALFSVLAIVLALANAARRTRTEDAALYTLAGGALSACFAGDLISFVAAAELSMLAAVTLLLLKPDESAQRAGLRLLGWQALGGVMITTGAAYQLALTGGGAFGRMSPDTPGGALVLAAFALKACFPVAHVWLKDGAAEASPMGTAALMAFTPALGVYGLLRSFAGEPVLVYSGVAMALLPALHAYFDADWRRGLAYGFVAQLGVMVAAAGLGGPMGAAGAAGHAFTAAVGFSALALGAAGGSGRNAERPTPAAFLCIAVAAASLAAVPGTAGFASAALVFDAAERSAFPWVWWVLTAALVLIAAHTSLRVVHLGLAAAAEGRRAPAKSDGGGAEVGATAAAPGLDLGLVMAAFLCLAIGVAPRWLYGLLPLGRAEFSPYDGPRLLLHVAIALAGLGLFALLIAAARRFAWLAPASAPSGLADADALISGPLQGAAIACGRGMARLMAVWRAAELRSARLAGSALARLMTWADRPARRAPEALYWCSVLFAVIAALMIRQV